MKALLQNNPLSESEKTLVVGALRSSNRERGIIISRSLRRIAIKMNGFRNGNDKKFIDACKNTAEAFKETTRLLKTIKFKP